MDAARSRVTRLDTVSKMAVVVYPIVLPDRIEVLVNMPAGLKRFSVPVTAASPHERSQHLSKDAGEINDVRVSPPCADAL